MYHYKAFNLHFITPFECPELIEIDSGENKLERISIKYARTPKTLKNILNVGPTFQSNNDELLLQLQTVGNYYIKYGNEILIEKKDETITEDIVRLFLFGSAIGALLQQRDLLVLHASAFKTNKGAVLICGTSGAGKSTTLQSFIKKGYQKLSDDTIALYYDEQEKKIMCLPSYPQSKLWKKSLDMLDYESNGLKRVGLEIEKFALSTKEYFYDKPLALHAIFILATHQKEDIEINKIEGMARFNVIRNQTYRKNFLNKLIHKKTQLKLGTLSINQAMIHRVLRPSTSNTIEKLCNKIEESI